MKNTEMQYRGKLIIFMNQFPQADNPLGYTRTTQRGCHFDKRYKLYEVWKDFVASQFKFQCGDLRCEDGKKSCLEMMIYYKNNRKPDPSNVFKGIEDALADKKVQKILTIKRLYKNDNLNAGSFDFDYDKENPRVEVSIFF